MCKLYEKWYILVSYAWIYLFLGLKSSLNPTEYEYPMNSLLLVIARLSLPFTIYQSHIFSSPGLNPTEYDRKLVKMSNTFFYHFAIYHLPITHIFPFPGLNPTEYDRKLVEMRETVGDTIREVAEFNFQTNEEIMDKIANQQRWGGLTVLLFLPFTR